MSFDQPWGPSTSNSRRPITTAPLAAVAPSRISVSTGTCSVTHAWSLGGISEPVFRVGAGPRHVTVERHGDVGDDLRHGSLLFGSSLVVGRRVRRRLIAADRRA